MNSLAGCQSSLVSCQTPPTQQPCKEPSNKAIAAWAQDDMNMNMHKMAFISDMTVENWHFCRSTESRDEEAELAGEGRRLSRKGRRSSEPVAVRMTASMMSPSTASVSELCPLLNRARDLRVLDVGPSRRPNRREGKLSKVYPQYYQYIPCTNWSYK